MWWIIIVIVVIAIVKFARDSAKQADAVVKQGGMRKKYRILVEYLLSGDSRARVVQESATFLNIGVSSPGGKTAFWLQQTFGALTVQWRIESPIFGKHKLEWRFNEFADQYDMIRRIVNDVEQYQNNLMQRFM